MSSFITPLFRIIKKSKTLPEGFKNGIFLVTNNWDDYGYGTTFFVVYFDSSGEKIEVGHVKVGKFGMNSTLQSPTLYTELPIEFPILNDSFFSLGCDAEYYEKLNSLSSEIKNLILNALNDIINSKSLSSKTEWLDKVYQEAVFIDSLKRDISNYELEEQFPRIVSGGRKLTNYHFSYERRETEAKGKIVLSFQVSPEHKPSSNIHVLIGRNGSGKTSLLNEMVLSIVDEKRNPDGEFFINRNGIKIKLNSDYFSTLTSVSYSAFDSFIPPLNRDDDRSGFRFNFIGMKKVIVNEASGIIETEALDKPSLNNEFIKSFNKCLEKEGTKVLWREAIATLDSDTNFKNMRLTELVDYKEVNGLGVADIALKRFERMSSGHAIVLLILTKLVETTKERTLVLMDEPESHLHPPLLSAFIRAVSDLLMKQNGVAIIATHSPVILQEVPKTCVWKINRSGTEVVPLRPDTETFGENVGILTRDVFGLEVHNSGFHQLLKRMVEDGNNYDDVMSEISEELGMEGRAALRALISSNKD